MKAREYLAEMGEECNERVARACILASSLVDGEKELSGEQLLEIATRLRDACGSNAGVHLLAARLARFINEA